MTGCSADQRHAGTLVGSLLGVRALGKDSVRRTFGARSPNLLKVGEALERETFPEVDREICTDAVLTALQDAYPDSGQYIAFDYRDLEALSGVYFAGHIQARCSRDVPKGLLLDPNETLESSLEVNGARPVQHSGVSGQSTTRDNSLDADESLSDEAEGEASSEGEGSGEGLVEGEIRDNEEEDVDMNGISS